MHKGVDLRFYNAPIWMVCRVSYICGKALFVGIFDFEGLI